MIQANNFTCELLEKAFERYGKIISSLIYTTNRRERKHTERPQIVEQIKWYENTFFDGYLDEVTVDLTEECQAQLTTNSTENCEQN